MNKLTLKGCHLKEKLGFVKEIEMEKSHPDYRYLMGWLSPAEERRALRFRESRLPKREYAYVDMRP